MACPQSEESISAMAAQISRFPEIKAARYGLKPPISRFPNAFFGITELT
jgi:hypothetical protein